MTVAPAIGFGCASLGSRVGKRDGLAALGRAFDAGVTWFDVAPAYGDGDAETILGEFARAVRGGSVTIATKVGLLPGRSGATRPLRPLARAALRAMPGLRDMIRRVRPANRKTPLTPELIARSVDESLKRLGVAQIDILSLHDATPEEARDEAVLRVLETLRASGKVSQVGLASSPEAALAGVAASPIYTQVQVANNPFEPALDALVPHLPAQGRPRIVTHSAIGSGFHVDWLARAMVATPSLSQAMAAAGYAGAPRDAAIGFLTDYALSAHDVDVVLFSMFAPGHLTANLARAGRSHVSADLARVRAAIEVARAGELR